MQKFLLGFVIGLVFAGLVVVILGFTAIAVIGRGQAPPPVAASAVLVLDLAGLVPEQSPVDIPIPLLGQESSLTVLETWQMLRKAATDTRIKAVVLEPRGLDVGWAKLEELRAQILKFKESGKPVYAFLRAASAREYYVATAADQIFMTPQDWLDVKGLRAELMFLKGTLDKIGVAMEFESVGLYKDAPDSYTKTGPSPPTLEVTNQLLDQYYGNLVQAIAQGRKREPATIRAAIDQGPFIGQKAVDSGMIDGLLFEEQVYKRLDEQVKAGVLKKVRAKSYSRAAVPGSTSGGARIAVITGDGEILPGSVGQSLGEAGMTAAGMAKVLREVREDSGIKGVILRVDSPGGDAVASDEILHEVKELSKKKPLLISMSDYAASGGYMMSMTGDPVLAYSNTLTGSIGVFFGKLTLRGLYDKIGINKFLLLRGRWAAIDSDYTPLGPAERTRLQGELQTYYRGFVQLVADGRKQPYEKIEPLAQGRVWLGAQAKDNGLIDEIGGLDRAVEMIKERAHIGASERVSLEAYPARRSFLEVLLNREAPESGLDAAIDKVAGRLPWRALTTGGVMQLMPYTIEVK